MSILNRIKYPIRCLIGTIAIVASVAGVILLISRAATEGTIWHVVSFSIYGVSLIALWMVSTLYHSLNISSEVNRTLEQFDHAMIYLLIAGTYTPVCLVVLRGSWGWSLLGVNWGLAITGMILKIAFRHPPRGVVVVLFVFYIIMGWLIVIAWPPLARALPQQGLFWLISGGVFYTVGACVLGIKRLNFTPWFGAHEIWHLFVMAGSFSHFWMMLNYILYLN